MSFQYRAFGISSIRRSNGPKGLGKTAYNVYQKLSFSLATWTFSNGVQSFSFPIQDIIFAYQEVREPDVRPGQHHLRGIEFKGGG